MFQLPKLLITLGIILIVIGGIWLLAGRWLPIGKLPGDIVVKKENFTFYFPIVTCIVLSVIISLILYVIRLFR
ncbi:DUF2905 domain-containing protein [Paenibacillus larvae]|uniref:DUF2905 domain-containing protein n=2 Tax=Paenibacillus larvae TaxID=1464 RepID=A0A2L1UD58_9BACL|nr:DUF2905 domain-containing protein [Paenibacillus larvae]AQR77146.1 hypothetical protein BXP28_07025 [Paenibacillus larvae subsp. larvae]AQT86474.1 hypothetical protein B1222_22075 [Paenibacillus larvae subsp. pulvifaciens]AQZ48129.1 hypothetical protein B5S25_17650 [Paenibacillus larvae subsp. pulvifaciens]ARF66792.1 hypothetical protein B7C51_01640 [Paenibacillus larvae subsp. pulvifaciens]AVF21902.1 hypothetical protein ERICI_02043 [Paenibacillus larvae subsp. larvae]